MRASLIESADENFVVHATSALTGRTCARVRVDPDLVLVDSGIGSDAFNIACRLRMSPASARARVREACEFFAVGNRPFTFWLLPGYEPAELPSLLDAEGLVEVGTEAAMVLELARLKPPAPVSGLEIRPVAGRSDMRSFADILAANSTPPDPFVRAFYDLTESAFLDPASPQRLYLGCVDGQPAATAELTVAGGVAGLYNISTLAAFRGRGVGSAVTGHCLDEARRLGISTSVLQASVEGERVYRRLGFTALGTASEFKPAEPLRGRS